MAQGERHRTTDELREMVREGYARVAERSTSCCGGAPAHANELGKTIGYSEEELEAVPQGANLGLGCGNPTAHAELRPGDVVVDLGAGAGFDAFLAARAVGPEGRVIGVDMTEEMLTRARENARKGGFTNVEFRQGTIESLPIEDESVDVIISNCVINLSPEKERVFREAHRVLRPGGRLMISDIVLEKPLPPAVVESAEAYVGCVGGAVLRGEYLETIAKAGFRNVEVLNEARFADTFSTKDPQVRDAIERFGVTLEQAQAFLNSVTSLAVRARK
jgi:ubiquinone/menaquinone biosynthesis C-methylase UbiE